MDLTSGDEHRKTTTESPRVFDRKRKLSESEKKNGAAQQSVLMDGNPDSMDGGSVAKKRNCCEQLKLAHIKGKQQNNEANVFEKDMILTSSDELDGYDSPTRDFQQSLFEKLYGGVFPIPIDAAGGQLCIFSGTAETADRITKKFRIMKKLGVLVGCGLDCHFRMINDRYLLMMLVRGAPMSVFGTTVAMLPDLTNIRLHGSHPDFLEVGQKKFFESILQLLPSRLKEGKKTLLADLNNGEESNKVQKFYEFLKPIRASVITYISSIPFAWYIPDNADGVPEKFAEEIRNSMQKCTDNELVMQEQKKPGYGDAWQHEWGIVSPINFTELMDDVINTL